MPQCLQGGTQALFGHARGGGEWFERSAMADLLGEDLGLAEIHKLYRCHDRLLEHKQALFDHLVGRWRDLFNISFDVLLYDLTSTYFEADPPFARADFPHQRSSAVASQHCKRLQLPVGEAQFSLTWPIGSGAPEFSRHK
jgi:hypothetical protein